MEEIYLLESSIKRNHIVDFRNPAFKNRLNITVEHQLMLDTRLNITILLDFWAGTTRIKEISSKIKMTGVFLNGEDSVLTV